MATIEKFEDIESWKISREITKLVYAASSTGNFSKDFALVNQIRRASISILSNIAEGFERVAIRNFYNSWRLPKVLVVKFALNFM